MCCLMVAYSQVSVGWEEHPGIATRTSLFDSETIQPVLASTVNNVTSSTNNGDGTFTHSINVTFPKTLTLIAHITFGTVPHRLRNHRFCIQQQPYSSKLYLRLRKSCSFVLHPYNKTGFSDKGVYPSDRLSGYRFGSDILGFFSVRHR